MCCLSVGISVNYSNQLNKERFAPEKGEWEQRIGPEMLRKVVPYAYRSYMLSHGRPSSVRLDDGARGFGPSPFNQANPDYRQELVDTLKVWLSLVAESNGSAKFLDIGCGTGAVMSLVQQWNLSVEITGLEIDSVVGQNAEKFGKVLHCDARQFGGFSQFDAIFMYRPLVNNQDQYNLEKLVLAECKPGALVISVLPAHELFFEVDKGVYIKP